MKLLKILTMKQSKIIIKILRWIWEFPQCLLGFILTKIYKVELKEYYNNIAIYAGNFPSGISLGLYILLSNYSYKYNTNFGKEHEYGHTIQSKILGWLYLPTVGLVSSMWNILRFIFPKLSNIDYYSIWPENWADKLGNVKR